MKSSYKQVKLLEASTIEQLEKLINDFIDNSGKEVLNISYSSSQSKYSALIVYHDWNING